MTFPLRDFFFRLRRRERGASSVTFIFVRAAISGRD
jgi:hypothetical protein